MSFLELEMFKVAKLHHFYKVGNEVHDAYFVNNLWWELSDFFLLGDELFICKLWVAHGLEYVFLCEWVDHDVFSLDEEARDSG